MSISEQKHFSAVDVRFEHHLPGNVLGIGEARPRLSWKVAGTASNYMQGRYQIELYRSVSNKNDAPEPEAYNSIEVFSSQSHLVAWPANEPSQSRQRIYLRVRSWDSRTDTPSAWSDLVFVETGLLKRGDWQCKRVTAAWEQDPTIPKPEELYRRTFSLRRDTPLSRARLYITAQGLYEAEINGQRVGDYFLTPGWQSYSHNLRYQVYDVLQHLKQHNTFHHCIGVRVAEGWFSGRLGFAGGHRNIWGSRTALILQLELEYTDGSRQVVKTDESWLVTAGPIQKAEIYNGEKYDARKIVNGWSSYHQSNEDLAIAGWSQVKVLDLPYPHPELLAINHEPIGRIETMTPVDVISTPSGKTVLDFGQNLVGYTRIKSVSGARGHKVSLFHAEVFEHGECARRPL